MCLGCNVKQAQMAEFWTSPSSMQTHTVRTGVCVLLPTRRGSSMPPRADSPCHHCQRRDLPVWSAGYARYIGHQVCRYLHPIHTGDFFLRFLDYVEDHKTIEWVGCTNEVCICELSATIIIHLRGRYLMFDLHTWNASSSMHPTLQMDMLASSKVSVSS